MLILKVKLKADINLAFKNSEKHRQAITCTDARWDARCKSSYVIYILTWKSVKLTFDFLQIF